MNDPTTAEIQTRHASETTCMSCECKGHARKDRGVLLKQAKVTSATIKAIGEDNRLSECEADWCGKTVLRGVAQKCHRCNVKALLEDWRARGSDIENVGET